MTCLSTTAPAKIWTTWSASQKGSSRAVDLLTSCGPTVRRRDPLTPPSSERLSWDGLWGCQTWLQTSCIWTPSLYFFLRSTTPCLLQRCSQPWNAPARHLKARGHLLNTNNDTIHQNDLFSSWLVCLLDGIDCSLTFVAQTLGKVCIQGHSGE